MTLSWLQLASVLLLPLLLGAGVLRTIGIGFATDRLAFLGWAHLAGGLGTAVVVFVFLLFGWSLEARVLAPAVLLLAGVLLATSRGRPARWKSRRPPPSEADPVHSRWEQRGFAAVVAALVLLSVDHIATGNYEPVVRGDEAHLWASRAKVNFHTGKFGEEFRRNTVVRPYVSHPDYPPLNPLLQTWVFAHAGEIVHVEGRLPIQGFGVALILILASALRRRVRPSIAASGLLLLHALPMTYDQTLHAFSDLMLATGALVVIDAWLRRDEEPSRAWPWLMGLGLGAMVWSKNEGLLFFAVMAAAACLSELVRTQPNSVPVRRGALPPRTAWIPLWIPLVLATVQLGFNAYFGFENDIVGKERSDLGPLARLLGNLKERGLEVARHHFGEVYLVELSDVPGIGRAFGGTQPARLEQLYGGDPAQTRLVLAVFALLVLLFPLRIVRGSLIAPTLVVFGVLVAYWLVFVASPHADLRWHLLTAADRVTYHVLPAVVLLVAVALQRLYPCLAARARIT